MTTDANLFSRNHLDALRQIEYSIRHQCTATPGKACHYLDVALGMARQRGLHQGRLAVLRAFVAGAQAGHDTQVVSIIDSQPDCVMAFLAGAAAVPHWASENRNATLESIGQHRRALEEIAHVYSQQRTEAISR